MDNVLRLFANDGRTVIVPMTVENVRFWLDLMAESEHLSSCMTSLVQVSVPETNSRWYSNTKPGASVSSVVAVSATRKMCNACPHIVYWSAILMPGWTYLETTCVTRSELLDMLASLEVKLVS